MFPVYPRLCGPARAAVGVGPATWPSASVALCDRRATIGVMAIKAVARIGTWAEGEEQFATSWYAPQHEPAPVERGVRFALSTPGVTAFCTPGDVAILPLALDAARAYRPMSDDERAAAVAAMAGEDNIFPIPTGCIGFVRSSRYRKAIPATAQTTGMAQLMDGHAPVDDDRGAGDVARLVAQQEPHHLGDLHGVGDTGQGDLALDVGHALGDLRAAGASIGVSTAPGQTALARTASMAKRCASERVRPSSPAFDEQ